jgi:inorganic triphosphatase YgiF
MPGIPTTQAARGGPEFEIKLEAKASDIGLSRALALRPPSAPLAVVQPRSVYFDTSDLKLRENGVSLRVRWNGTRHVQTLKIHPRAGLPTRRLEVKREVEADSPQLTATEKRILREAGVNPKTTTLAPVFTVDVRRSRWLEAAGGIEVAVDDGHISANGQRTRFVEVELEDKGCGARELFRQAARFSVDGDLVVTTLTKAERGYRLACGEWEQPERWRSPALSAKMRAGEGFRALAESSVQQLMLNERALREGFSSRGVHQARVATRRLRAVLSFFGPIARDARFNRVKADVKWISRMLGAVRDLDVFCSTFLASTLRETNLPGGESLCLHFEHKRRIEFAKLTAAFRSIRFRESMLNLIEWLECGDWRTLSAIEGSPGAERFADFVGKRLRRRLKKLSGDARALSELDHQAVHALRRRAKTLRYIAESYELVSDARERERQRADTQALRTVQSILGQRQDLVVAETLLTAVAGECEEARSMVEYTSATYFAAGVLAQIAKSRPTIHLIHGARMALARLPTS